MGNRPIDVPRACAEHRSPSHIAERALARFARTQSSGRLRQMTTLRLEIVGPQAAALGAAAAKVFGTTGGTIGRLADNDWVVPDPYISSRHARIHWRNGQFLIEDTSSNGVFINSPDRRLGRGQMHTLQAGDRIFIDAYEIRVTLGATLAAPARETASPLADLLGAPPQSSPDPLRIPEDPFGGSGSFRAPTPQPKPRQTIPEDFTFGGADAASGSASPESIDPLKLLGLESKRPPQAVPRAEDLARRSPLNDHYQPPAAMTTPLKAPSPAAAEGRIPEGYDPLLDNGPSPAPDPFAARPTPTPPPPPRPAPGPRAGAQPPPVMPKERTAALPRTREFPSSPPPPSPPPLARREPVRREPARQEPARQESPPSGSLDFAALLAGAGLQGVQVTPELAEDFGRILRIVVGGLMDVLRARERIKDEFRMRMTTFKSTDNNPLKFSANVDDALHNLLVKRNSAYMSTAEAFEDAFTDVRNHQMAMLAGVRVAFDATLSEFDPDRLQETFDRQLKKGSLLPTPARLRYWGLYRDKFHDMVNDPESNFRELFGDEFARAYEEQLESLKAAAKAERK